MNFNIERLQATFQWYRITLLALDVLEQDIKNDPEKHLAQLQAESQNSILKQMGKSREELENFALLSFWALFEEILNEWLAQRTQWSGAGQEFDKNICDGLLRRIQHWGITEKIDALKPLLGQEITKNLHTLRRWRDWVAHRKAGARPVAVDFNMAQSLIVAALTALELYPDDKQQAIV